MASSTKDPNAVKGKKGSTVRLRHATPRKNLKSIQQQGLLTSKSKGRLKVVWLHTSTRSSWAVLHTVKRHGGRVEDVVIIETTVPRSWLRRSRRGLWYSQKDVPPERFLKLIGFKELAGPSLQD
jgi:hypothetical protein